VSITLSPVQNDKGPFADIIGAAGCGSTVNKVLAEDAVQPFTSEMVKE
jgi:hypothetical protein